MLIGEKNVLFVCGTDDHGSTSEVAAVKAGKPILEFIQDIHTTQKATLSSYDIGLDNYTGTSTPGTIEVHTKNCQNILRKLYKNKLLEKEAQSNGLMCLQTDSYRTVMSVELVLVVNTQEPTVTSATIAEQNTRPISS